MIRYTMAVCFLVVPRLGTAADITTSLQRIDSGFTGPFNPDPVDVYHLIAENPNGGLGVFTLDLVLTGSFVQADGFSVLMGSPNLFDLGGGQIADTFFVVPEAGTEFVANFTDDENTLAAAYTNAGGLADPVIPPNGSSVIATLSVPGGTVLDLPDVLGSAIARSSDPLESIEVLVLGPPVIPEPSAMLLAGLAMIPVFWRR